MRVHRSGSRAPTVGPFDEFDRIMSAMASAIWSSRWWMKPSVLRRRRPIVDIDELVRSTGQRLSSGAGCFTAQGCLERRAVDRDVGQIESHEPVAAGESFVDQTIEHPAYRRALLPIKSCRQRTKGQCRQPLSQQYPRVARHKAVKTEKPLTGSRYEGRPASHARPWRLMISSKCR